MLSVDPATCIIYNILYITHQYYVMLSTNTRPKTNRDIKIYIFFY